LLLADGPVTVYDLEALTRAPRTVILPACNAAVADVRAGDELLGTTAALVSLGVRSVVAPVLAVPDRATLRVSSALHRALAGGRPVPDALAAARSELLDDGDPLAGLAARSFVCVGAWDAGVSARPRG